MAEQNNGMTEEDKELLNDISDTFMAKAGSDLTPEELEFVKRLILKVYRYVQKNNIEDWNVIENSIIKNLWAQHLARPDISATILGNSENIKNILKKSSGYNI